MGGAKIEICKSAAAATAEMLKRKDEIGVVAFYSAARWIVPLTRASNKADIGARIATLTAGGGTNIYPGMSAAYEAVRSAKARVKHMIILSDGRTGGGGYEQLAASAQEAEITVSTVGVGHGADNRLLGAIATAGGGKHYATSDPSNIPRIFTQDAATHLGKLIPCHPHVIACLKIRPFACAACGSRMSRKSDVRQHQRKSCQYPPLSQSHPVNSVRILKGSRGGVGAEGGG